MKSHRPWIEIFVICTAIAFCTALLIAMLGTVAGAGEVNPVAPQASATVGQDLSYDGFVTCSRCGAKHPATLAQSATACVRICVHGGAAFSLVGSDSTYILEGGGDALKKLAGQRVHVVGSLSGQTIKVASVSADN
jgi:hypothetical protein